VGAGTSIRSILTRITVVYLLIIATGGLLTLWALGANADAEQAVRNAQVAAVQEALLRSSYSDQETGQRGFVISAEEQFLEPYRRGIDATTRLTADLRVSIGDSPELLERLSAVTDAGERWRTEHAEPEIAATRENPGSGASVVALSGGKARFDELRARLDELASGIADESVSAIDSSTVVTNRFRLIVAGTVISAILATVLAVVWVRRYVLNPLSQLVEAVGAVRAEELDFPLPLTGPEELVAVSTTVAAMRARLVRMIDQATRSRAALEQSAIVVLQLGAALQSELGDSPDGWTVAGGLRPAEGVLAGDCYDVFALSDSVVGLVVLDIVGHGAEVALTALKAKEMIVGSLRSGAEPGEAMRILYENFGEDRTEFLTAIALVVDTTSGRGTYANAGHPPALVFEHGGAQHELAPTGPLVGPVDAEWRTEAVTLEEGGKLVVFTDGVLEARSSDNEFFGVDRLAELVLSMPCIEAERVVQQCLDTVDDFTSRNNADDVSIVVVCRDCPPN